MSDLQAFRNALKLSDVLRLGGTWTVSEVVEFCGVSETLARNYLHAIEEHYPHEIEIDTMEPNGRRGRPPTIWRGDFEED